MPHQPWKQRYNATRRDTVARTPRFRSRTVSRVVKASKFTHTAPILKSIQWLKINERIKQNIHVSCRIPTVSCGVLSFSCRPWKISNQLVFNAFRWSLMCLAVFRQTRCLHSMTKQSSEVNFGTMVALHNLHYHYGSSSCNR